MRVKFSRGFSKQFDRVPSHIKNAFEKRLEFFIENRFHPFLNNHKLQGKFSTYRSIDITGDWRALFREYENGAIIVFEIIGTHSELYS